MKITKTQIDFWCFAGYFQYKIFKVVDGHKQVYYIAEPVIPSATRLGDTLEELRAKVEADIPRIIKYGIRNKEYQK